MWIWQSLVMVFEASVWWQLVVGQLLWQSLETVFDDNFYIGNVWWPSFSQKNPSQPCGKTKLGAYKCSKTEIQKKIYIYTHTIPKSIEQGIGQPPKRKNNASVISIELNLDAKIYIRSSIVVFTHPHKQPIATCQPCPPHLHLQSPCCQHQDTVPLPR